MCSTDYDDDYTMEIRSEVFGDDFDNVGWDPIEVDDSSEEAEQLFGY